MDAGYAGASQGAFSCFGCALTGHRRFPAP